MTTPDPKRGSAEMSNSLAASERVAVDPDASPGVSRDSGIDQVCRALKGIRFGEVRVIVQDGLIVQIDRLEKQRLR